MQLRFPFIPGGIETAYNGVPFTPATIDFHDNTAGMTFISGHTSTVTYYLSTRKIRSPSSTRTLVETLAIKRSIPNPYGDNGPQRDRFASLFQAPQAVHFGIAPLERSRDARAYR